jgi:hypothetical protein
LWEAHETKANELSGNLVSIHSLSEDWLVYHIGGSQIWIGWIEIGGEQWSDGSVIDYDGFAPGERNNGGGTNGGVELYGGLGNNDQDKTNWHDFANMNKRAVYRLPSSSLCAAYSAGYTCYSADSTGCSSTDCKSQILCPP